MTLILSFANAYHVLQVGDRLLTIGTSPWDRAANKTVIYEATNALVTVSYSGTAYLPDLFSNSHRSIPTDQWIAQELWGAQAYEREPGKPVALTNGTPGHRLDIRAALEHLRARLGTAVTRGSMGLSSQPPILSVVGWKKSGRNWIPIYYSIDRRERRTVKFEYAVRAEEKDWHLKAESRSQVWPLPRSNVNAETEQFLLDKLVEPSDIDDVEAALISTIQFAAKSNSVIGSDCMSVLLQRPDNPYGHAHYHAFNDHPRVLERRGPNAREITHAAGYSPWVVGPSHLYAAAVIAGHSPARIGRCTIDRAGPALAHSESQNIVGFMSGQKRPPFP